MSKQTVEVELTITNKDEYLASLNEITIALECACKAKKEFDALFGSTSNSVKGNLES